MAVAANQVVVLSVAKQDVVSSEPQNLIVSGATANRVGITNVSNSEQERVRRFFDDELPDGWVLTDAPIALNASATVSSGLTSAS